MDVILRARGCDVADKIKSEARRKVEHATRIFDRILDLEISFSEEHNPRIAEPAVVEITARTKGHTVRAVGAGVDHHEATDKAIARLERQLRRYKTRLVDRGRRAGKNGDHADPLTSVPTNGAGPKGNGHASNGKADDEPQIVRRKRFELDAMLPEDAVLQLELLGHDFYLFMNAATGEPNVIYRRGNGDVGLIEGNPSAATMEQPMLAAAGG